MRTKPQVLPELDRERRIPGDRGNPSLLQSPSQRISVIAAGSRPLEGAKIFLLNKILIHPPAAFGFEVLRCDDGTAIFARSVLACLVDGQNFSEPLRVSTRPAIQVIAMAPPVRRKIKQRPPSIGGQD